MKLNELSKHAKCDGCGNHIANSGLPIFWRIKAERFGIDATAVKRQRGQFQQSQSCGLFGE